MVYELVSNIDNADLERITVRIRDGKSFPFRLHHYCGAFLAGGAAI